MAGGWIGRGDDQPDQPQDDTAPLQALEPDRPYQGESIEGEPMRGVGQDIPYPQGIARGHQDPNAHPIENTNSLLDRTRDAILGARNYLYSPGHLITPEESEPGAPRSPLVGAKGALDAVPGGPYEGLQPNQLVNAGPFTAAGDAMIDAARRTKQQALHPADAAAQGAQSALNAGGELVKGLGGTFNDLGGAVATTLGAIPVVVDKARSMMKGEPTTSAQDWWFRNFVDPSIENSKYFAADQNADFAGKAANAIGRTIGIVDQAVLTGGTEAVPALAGAAQTARLATSNAVRAMAVPAVSQAVARGRDVYVKTGDADAAIKAARQVYVSQVLQGMVPLSAQGTLAKRLVTGGISGGAVTAASTVVGEDRLPTPEELATGVAQGALTAGIAGPRAAPDPFGQAKQPAGPAPKPPGGALPAPAKGGGPSPYPGYHWDPEAKGPEGNQNGMWMPDTAASDKSTPTPNNSGQARTEYQQKLLAVNDAAAKADKRSDVQVQSTDDGHEVQVGGKTVATFASKSNALAAVTKARNLVGTAPQSGLPADQSATPTTQEQPETGPKGAIITSNEPEKGSITPTVGNTNSAAGGSEQALQKETAAANLAPSQPESVRAGPPEKAPAEGTKETATPPAIEQNAQAGGKVTSDFGVPADSAHLGSGGDQSVPNRALADAKLFGDPGSAQAIHVKGFDSLSRDGQHLVLANMRRAVKDLEVRRSVVQAIPVSVMHVLAGQNLPAEHFLHDPAVLQHALAVPRNSPVPASVSGFIDALSDAVHGTKSPEALAGTKGSAGVPGEVSGASSESGVTSGAGEGSKGSGHHRPQVYQETSQGSSVETHKPQIGADGRIEFPWSGIPYRTNADASVIERNDGSAAKPKWVKTGSLGKVLTEAKRVIAASKSPETKQPAGETKAPVSATKASVSETKLPKRNTRTPDAREDSILQYLAKHPRGIDSVEATKQGIDPADMKGANTAVHQGFVRKPAFRAEAEVAAAAAYEATKGDRGGEALPERPHLDGIAREGLPQRRQRDATSEDFLHTFGFRGIEYGNWAASDERQKLVNFAFDGLHDLAEVLGIPPKALSLNGTMGLALGARGSRFAAHYEPDKLVINMAKETGQGSLAHEWGHAVDHYFGELGREDAYQTKARGATGWYDKPTSRTHLNLRPEMRDAWQGVMKALFQRDLTKAEAVRNAELELEKQQATLAHQTARLDKARAMPTPDQKFINDLDKWLAGHRHRVEIVGNHLAKLRDEQPRPGGYGKVDSSYFQQAKALSGKSAEKGYWARPTEMWARAFESYVFDRLKDMGAKSEYLVQGVEPDRFATGYKGNPYPAAERPAINAAIDHLVKSLEVDPGSHALRESRIAYSSDASLREPTDAYNGLTVTLDSGDGHSETIKAGFATRPGTTAAQADAGRAFLGSLIALRDRRAGARVLADGLTKAFVDQGHVSLVGQIARSPADLATLAQVYRDPRVEHLRVFLMQGDRIVEQVRYGERQPGAVSFKSGDDLDNHVLDLAEASGADGYYLLHNHPDGIASPSDADVLFTMRSAANIRGLRLKGHIVIDHNEYAEISPHGDTHVVSAPQFDGFNPRENPRVPHAALNTVLHSSYALAKIARMDEVQAALGNRGDVAMVVATDAHARVTAMAEYPVKALGGVVQAAARIRRLRAASGAGGRIFVLAKEPERLRHLFTAGLLDDLMDSDGRRSYLDAGEPIYGRAWNQFVDRGNLTNNVGEPRVDYSNIFYSALTRAADSAKRDKGTAAEWMGTLKNLPGVKQEELDWSGLAGWLENRGRVSKADLVEYLKANEIHVGEVLRRAPNPGLVDSVRAQLREKGYDLETGPDGDQSLTKLGNEDDEVEYDDAPADIRSLLDQIQGQHDAATKYDMHKLPGGENYRELLLTLPARDHITTRRVPSPPGWGDTDGGNVGIERTGDTGADFRSGHWDEPNVLAHIRFDERTDAEGKRTLHIAEIQSDWHQRGRKQGYAGSSDLTAKNAVYKGMGGELGWGHGYWEVTNANGGFITNIYETSAATEREAINEANRRIRENPSSTTVGRAVPDAPFKASWPELALKRMIRYAAEHGFERLSWDTGETNAERYGMNEKLAVAALHVGRQADGTYSIGADSENGPIDLPIMKASELPAVLGERIAERIINDPADRQEHDFDDYIKTGSQGMSGFYDRMLPAAVNKLVKKWGAKVEQATIDVESEDGANNHIQVHSIDITPAMRTSVMGGQAVMEPREPYGSDRDRANDRRYKPMGERAHRDPLSFAEPVDLSKLRINSISSMLADNTLAREIKGVVAPANVDVFSKETALHTRAALGELAQSTYEAQQKLDAFSKAFDILPHQERLDFIDAMENGLPQPNQKLQPAADVIRKLLDAWRMKVQSLGTGALQNWIDNYFPHIWQDPKKAKNAFGQVFGRRPLQGSKAFLKKRSIPTVKDGIALGLKPLSTNPLILTLLKIHEMGRFYTGTKLMETLKNYTIAPGITMADFIGANKPIPSGWAEINDAVGRVLQWSDIEGGFIIRGRYIMPENAAQVINNHLSASAMQGVLADTLRRFSSTVSSLQLGFSAFHLGFTTLDAMISKNALGIERLVAGDVVGATKAFMEGATPLGAAMNIRRGYQLLKAYGNPGGATPLLRQIVTGLMGAGGRVKMDTYFMAARGVSPFTGVGIKSLAQDVHGALTAPRGKLGELAKVTGAWAHDYPVRLWRDLEAMGREMPMWELPFEIAGRAVRASTSIIMEHIVPLQKLGVFSDLAHDFFRTHPAATPQETVAAMQRIWDSVDNRMGEMVYDNLFWSRTHKDLLHMAVRAVGWNLGTFREILGAPMDAVKILEKLSTPASIATIGSGRGGRPNDPFLRRLSDEMGHRIPYVIALVIGTGLLGAILGYLFGHKPQKLKDYYFPQTGALTKYGTPERMSMPSYMKDIVEYHTSPGQTILHKLNPIFGMIYDIYNNEDFYGDGIYDPDASGLKQLGQEALYPFRESLPFSFQGAKRFADEGHVRGGWLMKEAPFVGFNPAPGWITSPEIESTYQHERDEQKYIKTLERQQHEAKDAGETEKADALERQIRQRRVKIRQDSREIKRDRHQGQEAAEKIGAVTAGKSKSEQVAAIHAAGYPALAELWRSMPERPRPVIAQAMSAYA